MFSRRDLLIKNDTTWVHINPYDRISIDVGTIRRDRFDRTNLEAKQMRTLIYKFRFCRKLGLSFAAWYSINPFVGVSKCPCAGVHPLWKCVAQLVTSEVFAMFVSTGIHFFGYTKPAAIWVIYLQLFAHRIQGPPNRVFCEICFDSWFVSVSVFTCVGFVI